MRRRAGWGGHLRGPQIELLEGRQFDEVLGAGTGDVGEGQAEVLQVSKGARAQEAGQVRILQWVGMTLRAGRGSYPVGLIPLPRLQSTLSLTTLRASCPQKLWGGGSACDVTHSFESQLGYNQGQHPPKQSAHMHMHGVCVCVCVTVFHVNCWPPPLGSKPAGSHTCGMPWTVMFLSLTFSCPLNYS